MAKKSTLQTTSDTGTKKGDVLGTLATIMCDYPDWPPEDLAALHLFKHEVLASAYSFSLHVSPKRAQHAINDVLGKLFVAVNAAAK